MNPGNTESAARIFDSKPASMQPMSPPDELVHEWSRTTGLMPRGDVPLHACCPFGLLERNRPTGCCESASPPGKCLGDATGHPPAVYRFELVPPSISPTPGPGHDNAKPSETEAVTIFVWAPRGIPAGRRTLLLSSRVGRRPQDDAAWIQSLRHVAQRLGRAENSVLVTAPKLTCDPAARRIAARHGLPVLNLLAAREPAARTWLSRWAAGGKYEETEFESDAREFPIICWSPRPDLFHASYDAWAALVAHDIHVLKARPNGNAERAVEFALRHGRRVYLVRAANFAPPKNAARLQRAGAVPFLLLPQNRPKTRTTPASFAPETDACRRTSAPAIVSLKEWNPHRKPFLFHWTRPRQGPWPDQDLAAYWDELLESPKLSGCQIEWGPCDSLTRILCQEQIVPTNRLIRGRHRVVCFTHVPLQSFDQRRIFRAHLSRWDFSPFGIGICRGELVRLGARAVIYGDSARWKSLSDSDRPFFQLHDRAGTDWRAEREWRIVGKVDLAQLPPESAVVFVPDRPAAEFYARISRWPIVHLNDR